MAVKIVLLLFSVSSALCQQQSQHSFLGQNNDFLHYQPNPFRPSPIVQNYQPASQNVNYPSNLSGFREKPQIQTAGLSYTNNNNQQGSNRNPSYKPSGSNQNYQQNLGANYGSRETTYKPQTLGLSNQNNYQQNSDANYGSRETTYKPQTLGLSNQNNYQQNSGANYATNGGNINKRPINTKKPNNNLPETTSQQIQPLSKPKDLKPVSDFAWQLFQRLNHESEYVICPLSVQYLLSYVMHAADGQTRQEIQNVIKYNPSQLQWIINQLLSNTAKKELQIATALFLSNRVSLKKTYRDILQNNIDVIPVDFAAPNVFTRIYSDWVKQKTKGVTSNVQPVYDSSAKLILTSAVYYKGDWVFKLNPAGMENFYFTPLRASPVQMLSLVKKTQYGQLQNGAAHWISLPYSSEDFMIIILPLKQSVDDLIANLSIEDLYQSMDSYSFANVTLTIPKFKIEYKNSLIKVLHGMGIKQLFTSNAQLPNMIESREPLGISNVLQEASLEVNEEGSIATSVTSVSAIGLSFSPIPADVEFKVNRPFIAMIFDKQFRIPYFMAKVSQPK